ncbi:hypothetical protein D3C83_13930 [compost metagenome]
MSTATTRMVAQAAAAEVSSGMPVWRFRRIARYSVTTMTTIVSSSARRYRKRPQTLAGANGAPAAAP